MKGREPSNKKIVIINNIEYNGLCETENKTGIKGTTIWYRIHSKNYPNFYYKSYEPIKAEIAV